MAAMGRRRTTHHGLPPHMAQKGESYYYVKNGKPRVWLPLGNDYPIALGKWAVLEGQPIPEAARTFSQIAAWYTKDVIPDKAPRTQRDNEAELANLEAVFGASVIDTITPVDVATYRASRWSKKRLKDGEQPKLAKTRGNREIALLSDVFNFARERGFTTMPNPCTGVERNQERGRDRYPEDEEFDAIYAEGDELLQDAMDLLLTTGQRPSDVVKMKRTDLKHGLLHVKQGKTRRKIRISEEADLAAALERMQKRPRTATGVYLIQDDNGQPLSYWQLEDRYSAARERAAVKMPSVADLQMRDIRGKAATDVEDLAHAQALLGHTTRAMTEKYVKQRAGERVAPARRKRGAT
jgi:integrase